MTKKDEYLWLRKKKMFALKKGQRALLHKSPTIISNNFHSLQLYFWVPDKTRRKSFSPNWCFNDLISYHRNQGQLDDGGMPSHINCSHLSLPDDKAVTSHSQQQGDCVSSVL